MATRRLSAALTALAVLGLAPLARAEVLRPAAGESLAEAVARAADGDVVLVPPGIWRGPIRVERAITLRGDGGVIDGGGRGQVIVVTAAGATLEDLEVRASGSDLGAPDACVWTAPTATGVVIARGRFTDCAFGIYVQRSDHARIEGNTVVGRHEVREADRGNGIHFHDASFVAIRGNHVRGARDGLFIGATDDSLIEGNHITHTRYGVHYMWSHRNVIRRNIVEDSLAGFALMQSHFLQVEENVAVHNRRTGMLLRDGQDCLVRRNRLIANGQGLFVYNSLRERLDENLVMHNDVGAKLWGAMIVDSVFTGNAVIGNTRQISYVGSRDLVWGEGQAGNHFSDYLGWDQDADGTGDRPYRVDGLAPALIERHPSAVLLLRSPALELLSHLELRMPMLRTFTVTDRAPQVRPALLSEPRERVERPLALARHGDDGPSAH